MKKNKTLGIILLVLFGLAILGGIGNGDFANFGGKHIGYYVGYFSVMGALLVFGILNLIGKK